MREWKGRGRAHGCYTHAGCTSPIVLFMSVHSKGLFVCHVLRWRSVAAPQPMSHDVFPLPRVVRGRRGCGSTYRRTVARHVDRTAHRVRRSGGCRPVLHGRMSSVISPSKLLNHSRYVDFSDTDVDLRSRYFLVPGIRFSRWFQHLLAQFDSAKGFLIFDYFRE